jgi:hypothetical protein
MTQMKVAVGIGQGAGNQYFTNRKGAGRLSHGKNLSKLESMAGNGQPKKWGAL